MLTLSTRNNPKRGLSTAKALCVLLCLSMLGCMLLAGCAKKAEVPNVLEMTEQAAASALTAAGFTVAVAEEYSDEHKKGAVISQSHTGTQELGITITITISKGPQTIAINSTTFPDAVFRLWVKANIASGGDMLTAEMIEDTTSIDVEKMRISSLRGIEYFTALAELYCGENKLTSLDVSNNPALEVLCCYCNNLTSLDISGCTALEYLDCYLNNLTVLDVSHNPALEYLDCEFNSITFLYVSNNTALEYLNCSQNYLTSLDISSCTALISLDCSCNKITALDISNNFALSKLDCSYNRIADTSYLEELLAIGWIDGQVLPQN